jgi:hypothetical protein
VRDYRPDLSTSPILFSTGFHCFNVWPKADDKNAAFLEHLLMVPTCQTPTFSGVGLQRLRKLRFAPGKALKCEASHLSGDRDSLNLFVSSGLAAKN